MKPRQVAPCLRLTPHCGCVNDDNFSASLQLPIGSSQAVVSDIAHHNGLPPLKVCPIIAKTLNRRRRTLLIGIGLFALWAAISAGVVQALPAALAGDAAIGGPPSQTTTGLPPPQTTTVPPSLLAPGPAIWGLLGVSGYATGTREAPNGFAYDPLAGIDADLNYGLLPNKRLYLFLQDGLWVQRISTAASGASRREFDADLGVAWNYFDSLELRASAYSFNNLNRGTSLASPGGYADGVAVENRYYFASTNIYDIGRLSFVGLGYYPTKTLIGNNGRSFRPGLFAHAYLTEDLPTPFASYLYGGVQMTAENAVTPRLVDMDFGLAFRPIADRQALEFRLGDQVSDDLGGQVARNLVYGAVRLGFGIDQPSPDGTSASGPGTWSWPETWGVVGLPVYVGSHMAPNGVPFTPIFGVDAELNLGLVPNKKLYVFYDGSFWAQHSGAGITNARQGSFDFSKREMDSELGLAWNIYDSLELRSSLYALDNLNRGISLTQPAGGKQGSRSKAATSFPPPIPTISAARAILASATCRPRIWSEAMALASAPARSPTPI